VVQVHRVRAVDEGTCVRDRGALMAFRWSVVDAAVVHAVKGNGQVLLSSVCKAVRAALADRFDVTETVSGLTVFVQSIFRVDLKMYIVLA
jgi:hypothetical protein